MNKVYCGRTFRLMLVVSSALLISACAGNPTSPQASNNSPEVQQMLQEWKSMKPGIERMLTIEEEMNLLLGQLGKLNEALDESASSEQQIASAPINQGLPVQIDAGPALHSSEVTQSDESPQIEQTSPVAPPTPVAALPVETASVQEAEPEEWSQSTTNAHYALQVASIPDKSQLPVVWQELYAQNPDLLADLQPNFQHAFVNNKDYYRLKLGGFETQTQAQTRCRQLKAAGISCLVAEYSASDFDQLAGNQLTAQN